MRSLAALAFGFVALVSASAQTPGVNGTPGSTVIVGRPVFRQGNFFPNYGPSNNSYWQTGQPTTFYAFLGGVAPSNPFASGQGLQALQPTPGGSPFQPLPGVPYYNFNAPPPLAFPPNFSQAPIVGQSPAPSATPLPNGPMAIPGLGAFQAPVK